MQKENIIAAGQIVPLFFHQDAVAASQTAVAMKILEAADPSSGTASSLNDAYLMPWRYDIVGISARHTSARTGGTLTVDATIDGTVTGLQAILDGTNTQSHYAVQKRDLDRAAANSLVGVKLTTDGSWAPTDGGLVVTVWVLVYLAGV